MAKQIIYDTHDAIKFVKEKYPYMDYKADSVCE